MVRPSRSLQPFALSHTLDTHACTHVDEREGAQKLRPASRAPSASALTRPWKGLPLRSKYTLSIPFASARSPSFLPTLSAAGTSLPFSSFVSFSRVEAAQTMESFESSMIWP